MYTDLVMIILGVSLILYMILGGADFGAGIIELFIGDRSNSTISRAIAPIWEANHMWLIIAVVILFNGFPKAYTVLSTNLHIPVLLFLMAIILRGTAFTFRHYDAYHDESAKLYSALFRFSSLGAVFFLGVTISGFFGGTIPNGADGSFTELYIYPWFNLFSFSVGIFTVMLSAYIAAIFLLGEVETDEGYAILRKFIYRLFISSVLAGLAIFLSSFRIGLSFHQQFLDHPLAIAASILASLMVPFIFKWVSLKRIWQLRWMVGVQIVLIMMGWFAIQWPNFVMFEHGHSLTIYEAAAPLISMKILFWSLCCGVVVIFPGLYFLFRLFKTEPGKN